MIVRSLPSPLRRVLGCAYRLARPVFDPLRFGRVVPDYITFLLDLARYSRLQGAGQINIVDLYPCLGERSSSHPIDSYFYMGIWAAQRIKQDGAPEHVDVASKTDFVGLLSLLTKVTFIDLRPLEIDVPNLLCRSGSMLALPYPDNSVLSLSCLHAAEHVGLGRYGDPLDPLGTQKACRELSRVLAEGGYLYFALPIGIPGVRFNAHRVHTPQQILNYFGDLTLIEFSGVNDRGQFVENADVEEFARMGEVTGFFKFTKTSRDSNNLGRPERGK